MCAEKDKTTLALTRNLPDDEAAEEHIRKEK
jgi:hypothetical protein